MSAQPRWATERTDRETFGPKVAEVASALGFEPMPWQRDVLDVALEHVDGQFVYRNIAISVPRQSSKTTTALFMLVWRMLAAPCHAVYGAQTRLAARQKVLDDWLPVVQRSKLARLFDATKATGQEALRAPSKGSICRVTSSDETAGHGATLSVAVLDECWALGAEAEQATRPAMSTKRNGQLWLLSTAGTKRSVWWREKVELGRAAVDAGETSGIAYFEWSAAPDADPEDSATWRSCMPALGHTVSEATIAADFAAMSITEFRRAYLNQWVDDLDDAGWNVIGREAWEAARL
jgi:phage terminase large subunit-like protein